MQVIFKRIWELTNRRLRLVCYKEILLIEAVSVSFLEYCHFVLSLGVRKIPGSTQNEKKKKHYSFFVTIDPGGGFFFFFFFFFNYKSYCNYSVFHTALRLKGIVLWWVIYLPSSDAVCRNPVPKSSGKICCCFVMSRDLCCRVLTN